MKTTQLSSLLLPLAGGAFAQGSSPGSPIATDRPGFLFSSLTVGGRVVQAELGLPQVTLVLGGGAHGIQPDPADRRLLRPVVGLRSAVRLPRASRAAPGGTKMSALYLIGLLVAALLIVYLFVALLEPERF